MRVYRTWLRSIELTARCFRSHFREYPAGGHHPKPLILLVGAAGFEPTTCSTQNCRATRLRYTPIMLGNASIHAYPPAIKAMLGPARELSAC